MSARQRSKLGCWTCRLRKKKCAEDGPPCTNCDQFGVLCHGYGPRPTWKDRGEMEREEARKLRLHSRKPRTISQSSSGSVDPSMLADLSTNLYDISSPFQNDTAIQLTADTDLGYFSESQSTNIVSNLSLPLESDSWSNNFGNDSISELAALSPKSFSHQPRGAAVELMPPAKLSHFGISTSESEISLLVSFTEILFRRQYSMSDDCFLPQKAWLFRLLLRSPTFFSISLATSAYYSYLLESTDSAARESYLNQYQRHRDLAIRGFCSIDARSSHVHKEAVICGVYLATLEVLANNMQSYRQYLRGLPQFLVEEEQYAEDTSHLLHLEAGQPAIATAPGESPPSRTTTVAWPSLFPSKMEQSAASFFTAMFAWNEVLSSAAEIRIPEPQTKLRTFFADSTFSSVLKTITGCDAWMLGSIMDVTALEVSKRNQLSTGSLSVRGLVSQASKIEAALELQMKKLSRYEINSQDPYDESNHNHLPPEQSIRPRILGYAIIIYLNTVVSGALTGVPEIHQSISEVLPLWEKLSATPNCKYLTWAYSTTASLAARSQRPAFKKFITNTSLLCTSASTLRYFIASVEECWKETDRHEPNASNVPCDWRDMHMRANLSFVFF